MAQQKLTVLHVVLKDINICINLHYINKVLPLPMLEFVSTAPVYVAGLMNYKNQYIPVVDLAIFTGLLRNETYPLNIPLLLCSDDSGAKMCVIVDKVLGLSEIEEEQIVLSEGASKNNSAFIGTITLEKGISLLLDLKQIFNIRHQFIHLRTNHA